MQIEIKYESTVIGNRVYAAGSVAEVSEDIGKKMIADGQAKTVEKKSEPKKETKRAKSPSQNR